MKQILLLRHAKSSWQDPGRADHDRPLGDRGKKDSPKMGKYLAGVDISIEKVFCSTAKRAKKTLKRILRGMDREIDTEFTRDIYDDGEHSIVRLVLDLPDSLSTVMFVGHVPDMSNLVERYTGKPFPYPKFSTCAVALIEFDVDHWAEVTEGKGVLSSFQTPAMLESTPQEETMGGAP